MNDALIAYHEERARGGIGLIISEIGSVHPSTPHSLNIYKPEIEDGMRVFAERLQRHGTKVFQQLWHAGAAFGRPDGSPPWSASDIPNVAIGIVPTPMTKGMIDEIIGAYADCARRMEQYGLDGVDIHGAHGYLPAQFFSPNSNKREDEYGGSFENRARFIMELMRAVRGAVSRDFVVGIRVGTDLIENGLSIEDYLQGTLQDSTVLPADTVVLVSSNRQIRDVFEALRDRLADIHIVGDASSPRYVQTAIREGHLAGAAV
ncbi:oxidoreductase [Rhizorhabdus argentea]|uniref:oxidoreductase n=1 Tax=Rhizorhabdus argentea TaxID=1387174 RepID=UPI0030EB97EA